jgi:hypothetical protein
MSISTEFSQRPFIAGTIIGLRSFSVTPDGVLTGVTHRLPWSPGLNEAVCDGGRSPFVFAAFPPRASEPHRVAQVDCTCGFYAYFDERYNEFHSPINVLGIVESFGTVTVGSRGCRASKARLIALVRNDHAAHQDRVPAFSIPGCNCGMCDAGSPLVPVQWDTIAHRYPEAKVYDDAADALATHPLTPVEQPEESAQTGWSAVDFTSGTVTFAAPTMHSYKLAMQQVQQATSNFANFITAWDVKPSKVKPSKAEHECEESPQERAMRLKRERNTGPAARRLDGRRSKS